MQLDCWDDTVDLTRGSSPLEGEPKLPFAILVGGACESKSPPTKTPKSDLAPPQGGSCDVAPFEAYFADRRAA